MALKTRAEPGTRVQLDISPRRAAPSRAYEIGHGFGEVCEYDPVFDIYTVRMDGGEVLRLSSVHLKREDLGYGRKSRA